MLGVRYLLIDARLPLDRPDVAGLTGGEQPVFANRDVRVYANPGAFPHAWLIHDIRHVTQAQAFALLRDRAVDFRRVALVEGGSPGVAAPDPGLPDSATITRYEPERIEIRVIAAADGVLVVSDTYSRGWHATVDGKSSTIYPTNLVLRGVPVPKGAHTVVLTYTAPWLRAGLIISVIAHAILVLGLGFWVLGSRRAVISRG